MSALGGIGSATLVRRRRLGPAPLWLLALPIGAVLLLPLAFVGVQASGAGWTKAIHLLRLPHVDELLRNTIELVVLVPPLCAIVGAGVAWLLERTDLPGRRAWAVLVVIPLAVASALIVFVEVTVIGPVYCSVEPPAVVPGCVSSSV